MTSAPSELLKLEIGAGDKPRPGYIHHDIRPLPDIEVVCDARKFPAEEKGKYDEIYAANILEHFNRFEVHAVLKEWVSLLKVGGNATIIVPDLQEITRQYTNGFIDHEFFVYLAYGGNDYEFNKHYYGFSPAHLEETFRKCGLEPVRCTPGKRWEQRTSDRYCPMIVGVGKRVK
jgi:hypothetical protein